MSIRGLLNLYGQSKKLNRKNVNTALRLRLVQKIRFNLLKTMRNIAQKEDKFRETKLLRKRIKKNQNHSLLEEQENLLIHWLKRMKRQQRQMGIKYNDENRYDRRLLKLKRNLKCRGMADEFIADYFCKLRSAIQRQDEGVNEQKPKQLSTDKLNEFFKGNAEKARATVDKLEHFMKNGRNPKWDTFLHVNLNRFQPHQRAKGFSRLHKRDPNLEIKRLVASLKQYNLGKKQDRRGRGKKNKIDSFESSLMHFLDACKKKKLEIKRLKGGESENQDGDGLACTVLQGPYKVPGRNSRSVEQLAKSQATSSLKLQKRAKSGTCKKAQFMNKAKKIHKKIIGRRAAEKELQLQKPVESQKIGKVLKKIKIIFMVLKAIKRNDENERKKSIQSSVNITTENAATSTINVLDEIPRWPFSVRRMSEANAAKISKITSNHPDLIGLTLQKPDILSRKNSFNLPEVEVWFNVKENVEKTVYPKSSEEDYSAKEHDRKFSIYTPDKYKIDLAQKMEKIIEDHLFVQNAKRFYQLIKSDNIPRSESIMNLLIDYGDNQSRYNRVLFNLPEPLLAGKQQFIIKSLQRHYNNALNILEDIKQREKRLSIDKVAIAEYDITSIREKWINYFMGSAKNNFHMKKFNLYSIFESGKKQSKKPLRKKIKRTILKTPLQNSFHIKNTKRMQEYFNKLKANEPPKPPPSLASPKVCSECGMPIHECGISYIDSEEALMPIRAGLHL